ncbi:MAG: hypothetical protein MUF83_03900 [Acidimicrobiales bacterium]|jgi:hypothetical protein|nr:hypothetical protein [Acidimicrobiales bacterium]
MTTRTRARRGLAVVAAALLLAAGCGDDEDEATESSQQDTATEEASGFEGELAGTFSIDPATCDAEGVRGSYFRMIQAGGTAEEGPFVPNTDSSCTDQTYNPLTGGSESGLVTGEFQAPPDPAFDAAGNGLATDIIEPVTFFAVQFAVATSDADGAATPTVTATSGELTGDLSAWTAYYSNLVFNQGAPKPDGSSPGLTAAVSGTIDADTGAYTLDWSSQIVGGAFNDFTGVWHLEGTFTPAG